MPNSVLTKWRSTIARTTVLAVLASMLVIGAAPAGAAVDTSATCPPNVPSAGFTDVAGLDAKAQKAIDCLKFYGISAGTSATTFSPDLGVARWQMAIFLIREAEDHGIVLPSGADQGFTDIGTLDATAQKAINQIKQLGVTAGTSATTFSPNDIVPRWQMAIFLTKLADSAGVTLPSGAPQGFTDISELSAAAQTAINQAKQLGITDGFSATMFSPNTDVLRWQMALFIIATMAVDNVVPTGLGFPVVSIAGTTITYFDASSGTNKTVTFAATDSFKVDGVAATMAAFTVAVTPGDLLAWTGTTTKSFALTNQSVAGNLVSNVDLVADTVDIVDPVTGTVLQTYDYTPGGTVVYQVDGTAVILAQFEADLSAGDTIGVTGSGTAASPFVVALTNQVVTGMAAGVGVPAAFDFSVKTAAGATLGVLQAVAADTLTIAGATATEAAFEAALSDGDTITYSKKNDIQTIDLVEGAPPAMTGRVLSFDTTANTITFDAGPATAVTTPDYSTLASRTVDGAIAQESDVDAKVSVGDTVTYQPDNPATTTVDESSLALTTGPTSGTPVVLVPGAGGTVTLQFDANGPASQAIVTDAFVPVGADERLVGNTSVMYVTVVSGTTTNPATQAQFEAAVNAIIGGTTTGTVALSDSDTTTVWTVTTP